MNNDNKSILNGTSYQNSDSTCITYDSLEELTATTSSVDNRVCQNNVGLDDDKIRINHD